MLELNEIYLGDCLEVMKEIDDKSIDLVIIDPPYNIKKDIWDDIPDYIIFMKKVFNQLERILKETGSFYFFHNNFLTIVELQNILNNNNTFIFKNLLIWNKKFNGAKNEAYLQGFNEITTLRNYQKMCEYILFYTFQDEKMQDIKYFKNLRQYFKDLLLYTKLNKSEIISIYGQEFDHCFRFNSTQFSLPTESSYNTLINEFNLNEWKLFRNYNDLYKEFSDSRYTFNNQKTHHSILNFEIAPKIGHITPKPEKLIETFIKYSSNKGDIILDCFMGSGTTAIACLNTARQYIGIEKDEGYFKIAQERIKKWYIS